MTIGVAAPRGHVGRTRVGSIDGLAAGEVALDATGAAVTHLRCGYFFTNLPMDLDSIRSGVLAAAMEPDRPLPWVAARRHRRRCRRPIALTDMDGTERPTRARPRGPVLPPDRARAEHGPGSSGRGPTANRRRCSGQLTGLSLPANHVEAVVMLSKPSCCSPASWRSLQSIRHLVREQSLGRPQLSSRRSRCPATAHTFGPASATRACGLLQISRERRDRH